MATRKAKTRIRWWGPKPQPPADVNRGKFPHTDMPKLPGYEKTKCGGRHAGIEYRQTYPDHTGARFCDFCDDRVRGVLSPAAEAKADRLFSNLKAGGKASTAAARAKRRRTAGARTAAGGRWGLRDKKTGRFKKRGKR